jgi:hypothetical protein
MTSIEYTDEELEIAKLMANEFIARYEMPQYGDQYKKEVRIAKNLKQKYDRV